MKTYPARIFWGILSLLLAACGANSTPTLPATSTATANLSPTNTVAPATGTPLMLPTPIKVQNATMSPLPGGAIEVFSLNPNSPSMLYAVTSGGALFQSLDGGQNWQMVHPGIAEEAIIQLSTDPFIPGGLYAVSEAGNLYQSIDDGRSWIKNDQAGFVRRLIIDPLTPNSLHTLDGYGNTSAGSGLDPEETITNMFFAPTESGVRYVTTQKAGEGGKIYQSADGGNTWSARSAGLPPTTIDALAIDPQAPETLYLAMGSGGQEENYGLPAGDLYKSTDGGQNWQALQIPSTYCLQNLLVNPTNSSILYATIENSKDGFLSENNMAGVYKSKDGGKHWSELKLPGKPYHWKNSLALDPQNPETLYANTEQGLLKSINGGHDWAAANTGISAVITNQLVIDPRKPSTLYAGGWSGIFKSTDNGKEWRNINPTLRVTALAVDPATPTILYAGTDAQGVFKSEDAGESWQAINQGLESLAIRGEWGNRGGLLIDPRNPNTLYVAAYAYGDVRGGIFKSMDAGASWMQLTNEINRADILAFDPADSNTLYAEAYGNLWKSADAGAHWETITTGLWDSDPMTGLVIQGENLYASLYMNGFFQSKDAGKNWMTLTKGLPTHPGTDGTSQLLKPISVLAADPAHPGALYAGIGGWQHGGGLYHCANDCQSWLEIEIGLPAQTYITDLVFDPADPNHFYIATYGRGIWSVKLKP